MTTNRPITRATILPAGPEHLPAIAALAEVVWRAYYPGIISVAQIDYMLARMYDLDGMRQELSAGIRYDRLLVEDELVGFASYGPAGSIPAAVTSAASMEPGSLKSSPNRREKVAEGRVRAGLLGADEELKLHKLYVHPAWQRRGLGTQLLQHVEHGARQRGFRGLILSVNKANYQAIAAYRKSGFTLREAVVVDIGGGFVMDDYVMAKRLA